MSSKTMMVRMLLSMVNGIESRLEFYFVPQLAGNNLADMWFQQDGATCHTARATIDLLKESFDERIISRNGSN
ncbi:unnamed protein product [Euphydryas editha]|uniref:Tc1-like transposase DDE domain-containing protein n=1 Tax=Euphydryas editha TaxID=104508 RepID=A0AAU9TS81_EUPED|nr:unnamed protein product [Euphydryas editha]